MMKKYKKPNWQWVQIGERDIRLFKTILEQKSLRRTEVIEHIFDGKDFYAELRLRKLKKFSYLNAVRLWFREPESYLLGEAGVEALRENGSCIGNLGFPIVAGRTFPSPQTKIEPAAYEHDIKVTQVRFLLERLCFCRTWHSEKLLRMGTSGERKVPDGFFTHNGKGIAVEVEISPKKAETYRKIFRVYDKDEKITDIFYLCGDPSIFRKIKDLSFGTTDKTYWFVLLSELMHFKADALLRSHSKKVTLKELLERSSDRTVNQTATG